jgi:hypothetical protein
MITNPTNPSYPTALTWAKQHTPSLDQLLQICVQAPYLAHVLLHIIPAVVNGSTAHVVQTETELNPEQTLRNISSHTKELMETVTKQNQIPVPKNPPTASTDPLHLQIERLSPEEIKKRLEPCHHFAVEQVDNGNWDENDLLQYEQKQLLACRKAREKISANQNSLLAQNGGLEIQVSQYKDSLRLLKANHTQLLTDVTTTGSKLSATLDKFDKLAKQEEPLQEIIKEGQQGYKTRVEESLPIENSILFFILIHLMYRSYRHIQNPKHRNPSKLPQKRKAITMATHTTLNLAFTALLFYSSQWLSSLLFNWTAKPEEHEFDNYNQAEQDVGKMLAPLFTIGLFKLTQKTAEKFRDKTVDHFLGNKKSRSRESSGTTLKALRPVFSRERQSGYNEVNGDDDDDIPPV